MPRQLYPDVAALLAPETLGAIEGRAVIAVWQQPFKMADSLSGSRFLAVESDDGHGDLRRYVLKRLDPATDWLMQACGDTDGRAARAWEAGVFERLPPVIEHGYVAGARDGDAGKALLLRDLSDGLVPPGDAPVHLDDHARFLDAMATLHAACWGDAAFVAEARGFCALRQHYHFLAPATASRVLATGADIPSMVLAGWEQLPRLTAPDVAAVIGALLANPQPLVDAIGRTPRTLLHGDWKFGNLGLRRAPEPRVTLLDWDRVSEGPACLDLAWYLAVNAARLPESKEASIDRYRSALAGRLGAAFSEAWWAPQLALSLLGGFLQLGWPKLLGAAAENQREHAEIDWWSERVRDGTRWL